MRDGLNNAVSICDQDGRDHPLTFKADFNMNPKDTERANKRRERERQKLEEGPRPQPRPAREPGWVTKAAGVTPAKTRSATVSG